MYLMRAGWSECMREAEPRVVSLLYASAAVSHNLSRMGSPAFFVRRSASSTVCAAMSSERDGEILTLGDVFFQSLCSS
jgi:hypothetical protein